MLCYFMLILPIKWLNIFENKLYQHRFRHCPKITNNYTLSKIVSLSRLEEVIISCYNTIVQLLTILSLSLNYSTLLYHTLH